MLREPSESNSQFLPFTEQELDTTIVARFRQVARSMGSSAAVVMNDASISFEDLDLTSDALANQLLRTFGEVREPVALFFSHGISHNCAQLAVLKSGRFFVNVDPGSSERHAAILNDVGARIVLSDSEHEALAHAVAKQFKDMHVLNVECLTPAADLEYPPSVNVNPHDLATIVYTSGSTGSPQGVMLTHQNLLFIARSHGRDFKLSVEDRATQICPLWTIASNSEIFSTLLNGACLYPYSIKRSGIPGYLKLLREERITTLVCSPALFRLLFGTAIRKQSYPAVRLIRLGGDRTTRADFNLYREVFSDECLLRLGYGSSEFVLATQFFVSRQSDVTDEVLPIGYPIAGCDVAVVNENGDEVETGQKGEIVLTSPYLSPGYWRNEALTSARFKLRAASQERSYLTRDIGYRDAMGRLHHAGRNDARVKIYGKFVSVDDVEKTLLGMTGIKDAVVLAVDHALKGAELAAFVVPSGPGLDAPAIRDTLLNQLPPEMVPSHILLLDALPLLVNNKVDRLKLKALVTRN